MFCIVQDFLCAVPTSAEKGAMLVSLPLPDSTCYKSLECCYLQPAQIVAMHILTIFGVWAFSALYVVQDTVNCNPDFRQQKQCYKQDTAINTSKTTTSGHV